MNLERRIERLKTANQKWKQVNEDLQNTNNSLRKRIKDLEASQPKWISVEDRLPYKNELVWAFFAPDYEGEVSMTPTAYHDGKNWHNVRSVVTHWMPLPQPPKSEKSTEVIKENLITEQTDKSED